MTFDKEAYWAQRGQKKSTAKEATILLCTVCKLRPGWMRYGKKWVKVPGQFEKDAAGRFVHKGCPGEKFLATQAPESAPAASKPQFEEQPRREGWGPSPLNKVLPLLNVAKALGLKVGE